MFTLGFMGSVLGGATTISVGGDADAPELSSVVVPADGLSIVLTYTDASDLDESSVPTNTDFTLGATHATVKSGGVAIDGSAKTVTLTFPTGIRVHDFEVPTVSYTAGASPIQDTEGNDAANLSAEAVTNNSTFLVGAVAIVGVMRAGVFTESGGALTAITNEVSGASWTVNGTVTYSATGFNTSYPGLSGWSTANYISTTEAALVAAGQNSLAFTAFALSEGASDAVNYMFGWGNTGFANQRTKAFGPHSSGAGKWGFFTIDNTPASVTSLSSASSDADPHCFTCMYSGTAISIQLDNATADPNAATHTIATDLTVDNFAWGVRPDSIPDNPFTGSMSMLVVLPSALTQSTGTTCRDTVSAYLKALGGTP